MLKSQLPYGSTGRRLCDNLRQTQACSFTIWAKLISWRLFLHISGYCTRRRKKRVCPYLEERKEAKRHCCVSLHVHILPHKYRFLFIGEITTECRVRTIFFQIRTQIKFGLVVGTNICPDVSNFGLFEVTVLGFFLLFFCSQQENHKGWVM